MIKIREILLCEGSIRLPKRYYYRLWGYAHQLWLRQEGDALILSHDYGDSIAMIKKLPTGIFLYIQPDLLEDIAAFNGDLLRIELLEPAYARSGAQNLSGDRRDHAGAVSRSGTDAEQKVA